MELSVHEAPGSIPGTKRRKVLTGPRCGPWGGSGHIPAPVEVLSEQRPLRMRKGQGQSRTEGPCLPTGHPGTFPFQKTPRRWETKHQLHPGPADDKCVFSFCLFILDRWLWALQS